MLSLACFWTGQSIYPLLCATLIPLVVELYFGSRVAHVTVHAAARATGCLASLNLPTGGTFRNKWQSLLTGRRQSLWADDGWANARGNSLRVLCHAP